MLATVVSVRRTKSIRHAIYLLARQTVCREQLTTIQYLLNDNPGDLAYRSYVIMVFLLSNLLPSRRLPA